MDAQAKSGVTALWLAAGEGRSDVIAELLKNGASASNSRSDGITALMGAAAGGHAEALNMLLEAGMWANHTIWRIEFCVFHMLVIRIQRPLRALVSSPEN